MRTAGHSLSSCTCKVTLRHAAHLLRHLFLHGCSSRGERLCRVGLTAGRRRCSVIQQVCQGLQAVVEPGHIPAAGQPLRARQGSVRAGGRANRLLPAAGRTAALRIALPALGLGAAQSAPAALLTLRVCNSGVSIPAPASPLAAPLQALCTADRQTAGGRSS